MKFNSGYLAIFFGFMLLLGCTGDAKTNTGNSVPADNAQPSKDSPEPAKDSAESAKEPAKTADSGFKNANYNGPFPAPEGMALEGTYGEDKFQYPTGSGTYRFKIQTAWEKPIACLDKTRTVIGSKGKSYDAGFYYGYQIGYADQDAFPQIAYDETPQGSLAGNEYYDEAYRIGYYRGYNDFSYYAMQYSCPPDSVSLERYDEDGWYRFDNIEDVPGLTIYGPAIPYSGTTFSSQSAFSSKGKSLSLNSDLTETELNGGTAELNLDRIDFFTSDLDSSEKSMTDEEIAKAFYDILKGEVDKKYSRDCALTEPLIESKTYGQNTFAQLSFIQACNAYSSASEARWKMHAYAFLRSASGNNMVIFYFDVPGEVKKKGSNEIDDSKLPSTSFISQFLEKVRFE